MRPRLQRLFDDQNGICWLCHHPMEPDEVSADHVIPQKYCKGKWTNADPRPLKAAHKICNSLRGHDLTERPPYYYHEKRLAIEAKLKRRKKLKANRKSKKVISVRHDDVGESFADH